MRKFSDYPQDYYFEYLSDCCGAHEYSDIEGMCGQCCEWSGFNYYDEDGNEVLENC